jgi:glycosyltransferase involved in cell wall biosynthesis
VTPESVAVVIPVRDGEAYLAEAIDSALGQTRPVAQVVVVDDGSTDGSLELARRYEPAVRCLSQPPGGIGPARNAGAAEAGGDYLTFLDADDRWPANRIERLLAPFRTDPSPDLVFGSIVEFVSPELDAAIAATLESRTEPHPASVAGTMLVCREAWERVGGFADDKLVSEYLDWLLRARELGLREAVVPDVVTERRLHSANNTRIQRQQLAEYARTLKAGLDRGRLNARRAGSGS